jgi:hypothetical protein
LPQSYSDWDASEPNAYSDSNSYAHTDIYTNGDSYAYADIYTDCDGNSYAYANGDSDSNVHRNRNCHSNGYRHRYSNCDGIAAAHTDAKTSSDTAAPTVRLAGCSLVWELASEPREFPVLRPCYSRLLFAARCSKKFLNTRSEASAPPTAEP